jgi:putative MFS transporter
MASRNPWWIPPFLGAVPDVEPRLVRLLGAVTLALAFEAYDISMLTSALKHIARDLDMPETHLGMYLAATRLGALPALLLVPLADRIGRRRVFLGTVVAISAGTFLTAFSRTAAEFVAVQTLTRAFILTGAAVAAVIITEEFPAAHRGWGIGIMGAVSSAGFGLGALLFAAIEHLPYGWRTLYAVGLVPVLLLPRFRREVPETERFAEARHHRTTGGPWHRPLRALARTYPLRAALITLAAGLFAVSEVAVFQFTGYFTQTVHGWSPGQYSAMVVIGGLVGILGNVVAGRLGDRIGRRLVGALFLGFFPLFAWLFYRGPAWSVPLAWTLFIFCQTGGGTVIRAFSTELFPTAQRGTAAGWVTLVQTLGWAGGLALVGLGTHAPGDLARRTSSLAFLALLAAPALLVLPETRRRELEAISREDAPARR